MASQDSGQSRSNINTETSRSSRHINRRRVLKYGITGSVTMIAGCSGGGGSESGGSSNGGSSGGSSSGSKELYLLSSQSAPETKKALRDAFDEWAGTKSQDISRKFEFIGIGGGKEQKIQSLMTSSNPPDFFYTGGAQTISFGQRGMLADAASVNDSAGTPENMRYVFDGMDIFVPLESNPPQAWWYRSDIMEDAGIEPADTWEQQLQNTEVLDQHLSDEKMAPMLMMANPEESMQQVLYDTFLWMNGSDIIQRESADEPPIVVIDKEPYRQRAIEALEHERKLYQYSPDSTNWGWSDIITSYSTELTCQTQYAGRIISNIDENNPDIADVTKVKEYPKPANFSGSEGVYQTHGSTNGVVFPKAAENTELAMEFVEFLMTSDHYSTMLLTAPLHKIPPNLDLLDGDAFQQNELVQRHPDWKTYIQNKMETVISYPACTNPPTVYYNQLTRDNQVVSGMHANAISGRKEPGQAIDDAATHMRNLIPKLEERFNA